MNRKSKIIGSTLYALLFGFGVSEGQQIGTAPVIGILYAQTESLGAPEVIAVREQLRVLGYLEPSG